MQGDELDRVIARIRKPFAHCCAEAGGRVEYCDCVNKDHGEAYYDVADPDAIQRAVVWLQQCQDWMLTNDLDMTCPMDVAPDQIADDLLAIRNRIKERETNNG